MKRKPVIIPSLHPPWNPELHDGSEPRVQPIMQLKELEPDRARYEQYRESLKRSSKCWKPRLPVRENPASGD